MRYSVVVLFSLCVFGCVESISAEDWPMWRHDAGRTGVSAADLPDALQLKWVRHLPKVTPAYHSARLQFDAGYEPIVADGRLLIASSRTDSVTAYEAVTGRELWVFRTNGPVRFAPAVSDASVCFGSDDGHLYCVDLKTGRLNWKHRAVPSDRRLLGNQRLISVWPVRGGPVIADGRVYFAAGVWPFEGVFVYAIDVSSGELIWRNERLGYLFGQQPHDTQAIGGLAPQGYLVVNDDELIVPCSTAYPARLNRQTGKLVEFALPSPGRLPGGWFAAMDPESARAIRRGKLTFDDVINRQLHEDKVNIGHGVSGISRTIRVGEQSLNFDDKFLGVKGTVHAVIAANEQMFISTREGGLYCFGATDATSEVEVKQWKEPIVELQTSQASIDLAHKLIDQATGLHGYALVVGLSDGSLVKALLKESKYHVIAIDDDSHRVEKLRIELIRAGRYGNRCAIIDGHPGEAGLPPYFATLITTETPQQMSESWDSVLPSLRPYGGIAALRLQSSNRVVTDETLRSIEPSNFELSEIDGNYFVRRFGPLPGAADYSGNYALCEDQLVRFPLGVLWFDDTLAHFKRSPQPRFTQGVMISRPKDWHAPRIKGNYEIDYPLLPPVLSDIYTGRVFENTEQQKVRSELPIVDGSNPQQSYYHAPHQKTKLHPEPPLAGERTNPLTGISEPRVFP